ncbi:putative Tetraspanin-11 [Hypsibius exemplaris]|uniref:Tetraspanin n=1 Tax=Hypsibius exemplaris TaxID=2072580 RepID=A0A1W0WBS7_HYPEX|nr:putative Tetraspanin-11 [Hypsibius exemplaris]
MSRKTKPIRSPAAESSSINFLVQILSFFNVFFILAGVGVLGVAIWTIVTHQTSFLVSTTYAVAAYLLVGAGFVVLIAGGIGFAGICKPSRGFLCAYVFLLLLVFLMEAAAGVLAYLYADQMKADLQMKLKDIILTGYGADASLSDAMDALQNSVGCCGSVFFDDWAASAWAEDTAVIARKNEHYTVVPDSCCKNVTTSCGAVSHPSNIYYDGCAETLAELLRTHLNIIGGVGLGVCAIQLFGAIMSCCLISKIKKPYNEVEDLDAQMRYR